MTFQPTLRFLRPRRDFPDMAGKSSTGRSPDGTSLNGRTMAFTRVVVTEVFFRETAANTYPARDGTNTLKKNNKWLN